MLAELTTTESVYTEDFLSGLAFPRRAQKHLSSPKQPLCHLTGSKANPDLASECIVTLETLPQVDEE